MSAPEKSAVTAAATPYCQNTRQGDEVLVLPEKLTGVVDRTMPDHATSVPVRLPHRSTRRWVSVQDLRLFVDGKPEEVAPHDGVFPRFGGLKPDYLAPKRSERPQRAARGGRKPPSEGMERSELTGGELTRPAGIQGPDIQALRRAADSLQQAIRQFLAATE